MVQLRRLPLRSVYAGRRSYPPGRDGPLGTPGLCEVSPGGLHSAVRADGCATPTCFAAESLQHDTDLPLGRVVLPGGPANVLHNLLGRHPRLGFLSCLMT